ncbi:MAG: hypothetical protein WA964_02855 [Ilumatobacter sp.]|uniref:hypothetical protein n=1 Tax=Ilumatobacter sp. TaxID=1967498 RepID=UPI003C73BE94
MKVAHLPGTHPYVDAIDPAALRRRDDWNTDELSAVGADLVHVHFGFEHLDRTRLANWIESVRARRIGLVHTVHDIDNPHLVDQRQHHERAALLIESADIVTTLTHDAAAVIRQRWNRTPEVVAHPPLARVRPRVVKVDPRPLLWLGTLRPNIDRAIVRQIVDTPAASVDVVIRTQGWDAAGADLQTALLQASASNRIALSIIERPTDQQLADLIGAAGALILPYGWGTHSGLVELATALGVPAVTTSSGCRGGQGAIVTSDERLLDVAHQVGRSGHQVPPSTSVVEARSAHRRLYSSLAGRAERPL